MALLQGAGRQRGIGRMAPVDWPREFWGSARRAAPACARLEIMFADNPRHQGQLAVTLHSTRRGIAGMSVSFRVPLMVSHTVSLSAFGQTGSVGTVPASLIS
jgi:hypothetical protein